MNMEMLAWVAAYLTLGVVTGVFAGMLGIGGGLLMVPMLTMMFARQGQFPSAEILHVALGTSMATIIFTSLASISAHHRHGGVLWSVVRTLTPAILLGTGLGTVFAAAVPARPLAIFFTLFVCLVAVQMAANWRPHANRVLPGRVGMGAVGAGIGALSSLVAIGGGSLTVPFLTWCNVSVKQAIGTSAAVGFPIAIGGTLGYIVNGWHSVGLPGGSLGYVYTPALAVLVVGTMLTAPVGARLAHQLPVAVLKRIFGALLVLLSAKMLWNLFSAP